MSNSRNTWKAGPRARLLATSSALALIASAWAADLALASDADAKPPLWIELGWQFSAVHDSSNFAAPFGSLIPQSGLTAPLDGPLNLPRSNETYAKLSFQPDGSDWVFAASVRYGRAKANGSIKQTAPASNGAGLYYFTRYPERGWVYTFPVVQKQHTNYIRAQTHTNETHLIMDFQAGLDVGLGMLSRHGTSVLSAGVRFAQLNTTQDITGMSAVPDAHFQYFYQKAHAFGPLNDHREFGYRQVWHVLSGNSRSTRNFDGMGPSLSWDATVPVAGHSEIGEVSVDWGLNAALLFGRQKKNVRHNTSGQYHCYVAYYRYRCEGDVGAGPVSDKSQLKTARHVLVPDLGGFLGASFHWKDIKVSAGYRADVFFRALDTAVPGGRKDDTRSFYGPFASISVGTGN